MPITFVRPAYTSRTCLICGWRSGAKDPNGRFMWGRCEWRCDRQLNAALNILKGADAGRWFYPDGPANEELTDMRAYGGEVAGACMPR